MAVWVRVYPGVAVNIDPYRSLRILPSAGYACLAVAGGEKSDLRELIPPKITRGTAINKE
jgi:hypothetical protein